HDVHQPARFAHRGLHHRPFRLILVLPTGQCADGALPRLCLCGFAMSWAAGYNRAFTRASAMHSKLVAGNWKMNGRLASNEALLDSMLPALPSGVDGALCVPFPYLHQLAAKLPESGVALGAQDISEHPDGA